MLAEKISTAQSVDNQLLRSFNIQEQHQGAFRRISDILRPHAVELATFYLENFFEAAGIRLDDEAKAVQIAKTAEYSRNKYTPPIDSDWIRRIEKMGELQFKLRAPSYANLSALSRSHRTSAELIFKGADTVEDGQFLVEQFMRVAALEVEIMVSSIQRLEREAHSSRISGNAENFEKSIADIITSATAESAHARQNSDRVARSAQALLALSNDVAAASTQSTAAMAEAARMSGGLNGAIEVIEGELGDAFKSFSELTETASHARDSAATLTAHAKSIENIVKTIRSVADQTKILALNALIEATSAGEAGGGFSIVAKEMKALATQTEDATHEIVSQLNEIGKTSSHAIKAHYTMSEKFEDLRSTSGRLRASLGEQTRHVHAIAACIDETAQSGHASARSIVEIRQRAESVSADIGEVTESVSQLDDSLGGLRNSAVDFLATLSR